MSVSVPQHGRVYQTFAYCVNHSLYYVLKYAATIMYRAEVWGNTYATNMKCLVLLQKHVVRLLAGAKRLDLTSRLLYSLRVLKAPDTGDKN